VTALNTPPLLWITGASQGIGAATAQEYLRAGWRVAATSRRPTDLPGVMDFPGDVTDADAMQSLLERIESAHGPVSLAILNAGTHIPTDGAAFRLADYQQLMTLNYGGCLSCLAALLPRMTARRSGRVALVASVAGYAGLPTASGYGASKAALIHLAEALKLELAPVGVGVSLINPGFVRTPLTDRNPFPMPFLMEPEDAARRIRRGLERGDFEIAFPRRFVLLLKMLRLLPYGLYFRLIARTTQGR
jgi:NAD(P)-dependent dehydrogenase (short-subunit alcohol dehydrogenase family)